MLAWNELSSRIDNNKAFNAMSGTPYFREAVYEQFSPEEYARRYAAMRGKMRALGLDAAIVPGGPSHWSFGGGMLWLSGHWEWHALAAYVLVPLEGEPTLKPYGASHPMRSATYARAATANMPK